MKITYQDLKSIHENHKDQKVVIATGCFDLFHPGHLDFLERSKQLGDILVVVVLSDAFVKQKKDPDRPIVNEQGRLSIVNGLACVDYVILANRSFDVSDYQTKYKITSKDQFLWEVYMPIFDHLQPDMITCSDKIKISDAASLRFKDQGITIQTIENITDFSTTNIINGIKKGNYE